MLMDNPEIVNWRKHFIIKIREYRKDGRSIFYLDESYIHQFHMHNKVWVDTTVTSAANVCIFVKGPNLGSPLSPLSIHLCVFQIQLFQEYFKNPNQNRYHPCIERVTLSIVKLHCNCFHEVFMTLAVQNQKKIVMHVAQCGKMKRLLLQTIFRQINYLVISLVKPPLLSRNFCQKHMRVKFRIFRTHTVLAIKKKFRQIKAITAILPQKLPCKNQSF